MEFPGSMPALLLAEFQEEGGEVEKLGTGSGVPTSSPTCPSQYDQFPYLGWWSIWATLAYPETLHFCQQLCCMQWQHRAIYDSGLLSLLL